MFKKEAFFYGAIKTIKAVTDILNDLKFVLFPITLCLWHLMHV